MKIKTVISDFSFFLSALRNLTFYKLQITNSEKKDFGPVASLFVKKTSENMEKGGKKTIFILKKADAKGTKTNFCEFRLFS